MKLFKSNSAYKTVYQVIRIRIIRVALFHFNVRFIYKKLLRCLMLIIIIYDRKYE